MIRTQAWAVAGMFLGGALIVGTVLAQQAYPPTAPSSAPPSAAPTMPTPPGGQAGPPVYTPVTPETLGIVSSAQQLIGTLVKLPDVFYEEVTTFPNDALDKGITPDKYYAFRTRPDGSDLICFVPRDSPDLAALKAAGPPRGAEIFIMGLVGRRIFVGDSGATSFSVDRVFLGHEEPRASKSAEKKPVVMTIEKVGPDGSILRQEFTIEKPGQRYLIHDLADPQNAAKDIYVTLQF
jgi:hypothetical protein